ncbi:MAG: AAA family ATPase [Gammaproteobacteria bacterium]|nr:AAA family ATPase [Gammaproteobacteria bacterium]
MTVLAAYNLKGGVGKTAAAVNLAWLASQEGARVLLVDLDPQGAASFYLRVQPELKGGSEKFIGRKSQILENIVPTAYERLSVVPADFSHRNLDLILNEEKHSADRLRRILKSVVDDFDYVLLDCPPGISLVSENVFNAADALLVPIIPTHLSLRAYDMLTEFLRCAGAESLELMPFFSMLDRRRQLHVQLVQQFAAQHAELLRVFIPYASQIERMGLEQAPVGVFAGPSDPGRAFAALWSIIKERLAAWS